MSKVVLIVDDSIVSRMMLKEIIVAHIPDVTIIEANGGEDCINKIEGQSTIDIALFDYNMPGMNGIELISAITDLITIPKRALLTANIQDEIKQKAADVNVSFLNKPITEQCISQFLNS